MGEPSLVAMLPIHECNGFVMDFATREILPRATVPVFFGASVFDPRADLHGIIASVIEQGFFGIANFPTATYKGKISKWGANGPEEVTGDLTLHGVTKPVTLKINSFLCKPNRTGKEVCGADALGSFNRADFGIVYGQPVFKPEVTLRISVEANAP